MVYLTRREHFNGAHRLYNSSWSEEENVRVFGKCANKNWHGHNFDLYVTVKGIPEAGTGFIMNAHELSRIIKREVAERLDHKNFNVDVPELQGVMPSTENVAMQIWKWLAPHITTCTLHCVKLVETENIYVEYFGE
ncbi:MAG: 6-carboxytetrahydropterin synthase [Bacteroidetes bacterium]|nr:6-carboxytetrahydropterin synthase [Bacteroidota bacterium]MBK8657352.1 6-carboxytetrahydropterin synthase [Bacteroidota bacterium]